MGSNISNEEKNIVTMWTTLLHERGIRYDDQLLRKLLLWCRSQGLEATTANAFSISVWEQAGSMLFDDATRGGKLATELLTTWRLVADTLKELQNEREKFGQEFNPSAVVETPVPLCESSSVMKPPMSPWASSKIRSDYEDSDGDNKMEEQGPNGELVMPLAPPPPFPLPSQSGGQSRSSINPFYPPLLSEEENGWGEPQMSTSMACSERSRLPPPVFMVNPGTGGPHCHPPRDEPVDGLKVLPTTTTIPSCEPVGFWKKINTPTVAERALGFADTLAVSVPSHQERDSDISNPGLSAFPVVQGEEQMSIRHVPYEWRVLNDLRMLVATYGVNSPPAMQFIQLLFSEHLTPYDLKQIAQVMFGPVHFPLFESVWRQYVENQALENMRLPLDDPRRGVGFAQLMGTPPFENPQLQAQLHRLILEQAKLLGFHAILKTAQMLEPAPRCTTVCQGAKESFLSHTEHRQRATGAQVTDPGIQQRPLMQLARENASGDCRQTMETLPGDSSDLEEMITTCDEAGNTQHKMTDLAESFSSVRLSHNHYSCEGAGHMKAQCPDKLKGGKNTMPMMGNCYRCGKPGHYAKQCRSKYHINGQLLGASGGRRRSARGGRMHTRMPSYQQPEPRQADVANQQEEPEDWLERMSPPLPQ